MTSVPYPFNSKMAKVQRRNCLENTLRPHERTSLAPRGDRSGFVGPLLAAFGAPIQHPFLISKQFLYWTLAICERKG